ncbi:hypothetical protein [Sarcina ventriculi]|uniref:hypothetical protein n=1 Tax=Sarcina ventriculi TaxID=1267 RepID=UPI001C123936|nr:hypothetical protein [Sarcina ventriculi]MBU5323380.1 hypothetical protein [Sarcina ventriculi]
MYFISKIVLRMDYEEFLESTPRQIIGLEILNSRYIETPFLTSYIKIHSPQTAENNQKEKIEKKTVSSLLDL